MVTLKPNMYVRYKYHNEQKIGKVDFITYNEFAGENFIGLTNNEGIFEGKILKASFDIIDLIEPGDFINGYKVTYIDKDNQIIRVDGFGWGTNIIRKDNIKNIVTKEQFDSMKYVVERNK